MKITNNARGPRGVQLSNGETRYLDPGETADLDVAEGHELYEGLSSGDEAKPLDRMNKAELLAVAAEKGVEKAKDKDGNEIAIADATNAQICEAIEALENA